MLPIVFPEDRKEQLSCPIPFHIEYLLKMNDDGVFIILKDSPTVVFQK